MARITHTYYPVTNGEEREREGGGGGREETHIENPGEE